MYFENPNLIQLNRVFDQNERKGFLRLDLNENPGGLPQGFIDEILKGVTPGFVAQYPETLEFSKMLARSLGTDISHLCLVNGSSEGIRYVIQAFTAPRGRIVGVVPSYFMFQVYSEMYDREFVNVPYREDLTMDVEDIVKELTNETQLLVLLNPNNPMGNVYSKAEFERILSVCREKQITVLIDEAYHYFYEGTFIRHALEQDHVFVTRTFSKLFSLAGCRLGYVVGWPEGVKLVQKLCTPHNTNAFALRFAGALLSRPDVVKSLVDAFKEGRRYLLETLDTNGYAHKGEAGNFLFIKTKKDAAEIVRRMKEEKRILIKSYPNVGCFGTCLRVTIGAKPYMEQFMAALLELDK